MITKGNETNELNPTYQSLGKFVAFILKSICKIDKDAANDALAMIEEILGNLPLGSVQSSDSRICLKSITLVFKPLRNWIETTFKGNEDKELQNRITAISNCFYF